MKNFLNLQQTRSSTILSAYSHSLRESSSRVMSTTLATSVWINLTMLRVLLWKYSSHLIRYLLTACSQFVKLLMMAWCQVLCLATLSLIAECALSMEDGVTFAPGTHLSLSSAQHKWCARSFQIQSLAYLNLWCQLKLLCQITSFLKFCRMFQASVEDASLVLNPFWRGSLTLVKVTKSTWGANAWTHWFLSLKWLAIRHISGRSAKVRPHLWWISVIMSVWVARSKLKSLITRVCSEFY